MIKKSKLLAFLVLCNVIAIHSFADTKSPRIINGKNTTINDIPWQVGLSSDEKNLFLGTSCGASIIHEKWLITAAHCFDEDLSAQPLKYAVIGISNLNNSDNSAQIIPFKNIIINEAYTATARTFDNDIALIELADRIDFEACGERCAKIDLLQADEESSLLADNTPVLVSGWGNTSTTGEDYPVELQKAEVFMLNCLDSDETPESFTNNMICAEADSKDSCQGDSGGPLAVLNSLGEYSLAGIVSWGPIPCAQQGLPGVYARVANYTCWVEEKTNQAVKARTNCSENGEALSLEEEQMPNSTSTNEQAPMADGETAPMADNKSRSDDDSSGALSHFGFFMMLLLGLVSRNRKLQPNR